MGWGYSYRLSTKPTADQEAARSVAMDAFLEGRMEHGKTILKTAGARLSKPQAKKIARLIQQQGRDQDAIDVLLTVFGKESAATMMAPAPTAKVGDVLYTSWGYDQTNIDFYEVMAVKGQSCTIAKIGQRVVGGGRGSDEVVAARGQFIGKPMTKRVLKGSRGTYEVKIGDHHAWLWDGKPKYQTASGYGR
jgi:hypothetical protein